MEKEKFLWNQLKEQTQPIGKFLDQSAIESALHKSPSGNNSKPFDVSWLHNALLLTHNESKAEHYLNRGNNASLIALGCALTAVEVVANAQGFKIQISLPDFEQAGWIVKIEFIPTVRCLPLAALISMLFQRATYRKAFQNSLVPLELKKELQKMKQGEAKIKFVDAGQTSSEFRSYLMQTETYLWKQSKATKDFLLGVRFFNHAQTSNERGIPAATLGVNGLLQILMALLSLIPSLASKLMHLPTLESIFLSSAIRNFENSHFLLIHTKNLEASNIVQAGQLAMKAWLKLESQGYRVQPMSSGSLSLLYAKKGLLPKDSKPEFKTLFNDVGPRILAEQFQLRQQENPVWLLRIGKAIPAVADKTRNFNRI